MNMDIFYQSPIGKMARDFLIFHIKKYLGESTSVKRMLLVGYGAPYVGEIGVQMQQTELADTLPFQDVMFDGVIVLHALEFAPDLARLMSEIQRVLVVDGRVIIVAPHRAGLWSWFEHTPFGIGRVFSRTQIRQLCDGAYLSPIDVRTALFSPPIDFSRHAMTRGLARVIESVGNALSLPCGGAVVACAQKRRYAGIGVKSPVPRPRSRLQWSHAHAKNSL